MSFVKEVGQGPHWRCIGTSNAGLLKHSTPFAFDFESSSTAEVSDQLKQGSHWCRKCESFIIHLYTTTQRSNRDSWDYMWIDCYLIKASIRIDLLLAVNWSLGSGTCLLRQHWDCFATLHAVGDFSCSCQTCILTFGGGTS